MTAKVIPRSHGPRQPQHKRQGLAVEMRGLQTPRERLWAAILSLHRAGKSSFTGTQLQEATSPLVQMRTLQNHLHAWALSGHLKQLNAKNQRTGRLVNVEFALVDELVSAPVVNRRGQPATRGTGLGNAAMWQAMKVLRSFTAQELAQAASLAPTSVKLATATTYCHRLALAGYLSASLPKAAKSQRGMATTYTLINNTGPYAPSISSLRVVFDRNTGALTPLQTAQEVCDAQE